jgi:exopolysaccharide production protein ExoY
MVVYQPARAPESLRWVLVGAAERLLALVLAFALAPLLVIVALTVFVLSRRSPLLCHLRIGRRGQPFWMLKLRTMWNGEPRPPRDPWLVEFVCRDPGPERKSPHDPRISSRFARFCRRYSIDELPQLVHVIGGRMSLVGPRPLTRSELNSQYGSSARDLLRIKPGITGLWQVMGRSRLTYRQRCRLDRFYIRERSVRLYLAILARTVPRVLSGKDSW